VSYEDVIDFDEKLKTLKRFLEDRIDKKNEPKDELSKKIIDKDDFSPQTQIETDTIDETIPEDEETSDIATTFQIVIQIDKVKLEYFKSIKKWQEIIADSHILVLKDKANKFVFPIIETSFKKHELTQIREWKNNKEKLSLKNETKAYNLFKKALIMDINSAIDSIFKPNTYEIKSIVIGKEYSKNNFFTYVEIANPIEKRSKKVKFRAKRLRINNEIMHPYGIHISDLIDIALKYCLTSESFNKKNPISTILLLYLAEVTYREDMK